mgnify:CR=1 FL=1
MLLIKTSPGLAQQVLCVQPQNKIMNARIADNVGILKLKMLVIVNIKEFPRGIKSDQAISFGTASTDDAGVRPGPGLKPQAPSNKRQASSSKLLKPQAQRLKLQAASSKLLDLAPWKKFQAPLIKGLY